MKLYVIINNRLDYVETPMLFTEYLDEAMTFGTEEDAQDVIDQNPLAEEEGETIAFIYKNA